MNLLYINYINYVGSRSSIGNLFLPVVEVKVRQGYSKKKTAIILIIEESLRYNDI